MAARANGFAEIYKINRGRHAQGLEVDHLGYSLEIHGLPLACTSWGVSSARLAASSLAYCAEDRSGLNQLIHRLVRGFLAKGIVLKRSILTDPGFTHAP